jgi:histone acetyltransferase
MSKKADSKKRKAASMEGEAPQPQPTPRCEESNPFDKIRHCIVTNDGDPTNLVRLVGLKSLFAKQLPKMPKDYIVRLVFDRRHKSLALLSNDPLDAGGDEEIIGGICYRPYPEMKFAEIAFCAVNSSQQVKVSTQF